MSQLIYKEIRLAAHPTLYIFILLGSLVIVPNYPYSAVFLFGCLAPLITLYNGRENQDTFYTASLPVKKRDVVTSKYLLFVIAQMTQLLISLPFAILKTQLPGMPSNAVGIEANVAYYGFGFIIFTVFNAIFFIQFYKTAYEAGKSVLLALIPVLLLEVAVETAVHIPALQWLDQTDKTSLIRQLPILAVGVLIYLLGNYAACRTAQRRFEKVDL